MSELHRLVYTSYRKPNCDDSQIQSILNSCKKNNPGRNVTGILMHSENRFLQYIEGTKEDLLALYDLIKGDPRHGGVNQRNFEPINERAFPSWQMAYKDVEKEGLNFNTTVSEQDKKQFKGMMEGAIDFSDEGMKLLKLFFRME